MKSSAIISVYKKLIDTGKITGKGVERYNELVSKYRKKLLSSTDSRRVVRARKYKYKNIEENKWKWILRILQLHLSLH